MHILYSRTRGDLNTGYAEGGTHPAGSGPGNAGRRTGTILAIVFSALVIMSCSAGCIRLIQKSVAESDMSPAKNLTSGDDDIPSAATVQLAGKSAGGGAATPGTGTMAAGPPPALVAETAPVLPDDPYPVQHAVRISGGNGTERLTRVPEFTRTYTLRGNATGLLANVTKGPLVIGFEIDPVYDCIEEPESCRGGLNSVNRPYCTITVRDNATRAIIAKDGYAREYSSLKTGRTITVYSSGQYHITLEGSSLTVALSITTGTAPAAAETTDTGSTAEKPLTLDEYRMRLVRMQGG